MKSDSVSRERNGTGTKQESLFAEEFGPIKQIKRLTFEDEIRSDLLLYSREPVLLKAESD